MEYTLATLAHDVLSEVKKPLTYQEIWNQGTVLGFTERFSRHLLDPVNALGAQLYRDSKRNENTIFTRVGNNPVRFYLKELPCGTQCEIPETVKSQKTTYNERQLHPLLAYFAFSNPVFNRGRNVYTKTIYHEKAKKNGYNKWNFPDMVGVYIPINDWGSEVIEFNRITDNNSVKIYSFELKINIDRNNYRECFFQAVSNSSWANEAYLVTANIKEDDDLLTELYRLSSLFGVGIIKLKLNDIDSSSVLYQAKPKDSLDWLTINKLSEVSCCFKEFIAEITNNYKSLNVNASRYDDIIDDPQKYIESLLNT